MKDYIQDLLNGYAYIDVQTNCRSINGIFTRDDEPGTPIPFEGNDGTIFEESPQYIAERFYESSGNSGYSLIIDDIPNEKGQLAVLELPNGSREYYYSEKPFDMDADDLIQFDNAVGKALTELKRQRVRINKWIGDARIKPTIYKLNAGWVIVFSGIVYGKQTNHMGVIAKTSEEANRIMDSLLKRLGETPVSRLSRRELFHDIVYREQYNGSKEANKLRYLYLKKIKKAYEEYDFSPLYDDIADDCSWGGARGKNAVIKNLSEGAISMKNRNYWHKCTLVQIGKGISPLRFNTKEDGTGKKVLLGLLYNRGEICMVDETPVQTLFFRMTIAPNGKIQEYYATLPSGSYHAID